VKDMQEKIMRFIDTSIGEKPAIIIAGNTRKNGGE
jgi:hypothetical protein